MDDIIERVKRHEGFRSHVYKDTLGNYTIGYGHLLTDLTKKQAEAILVDDLFIAESLLLHRAPYVIQLPLVVQGVFVEMVFQLGKRFFQFKKMQTAARQSDWKTVADETLNSKWAKQTPNRAAELADLVRSA